MTTENLPGPLVHRATRLVAAVHDYEILTAHDILGPADVDELRTMCVALAAMVEPDRTVRELLAWNDDRFTDQPALVDRPELRPCGTHAAYWRHKAHDEPIDDDCLAAERAYQHDRYQRRLAARNGGVPHLQAVS